MVLMNTPTSMMTTGALDSTDRVCFHSSLTPHSLRYDDGTKDESALPFHIHLSLALKQVIGTSADDGDDWNEDDSDYLGPTPKWFYSFYDDGTWSPTAFEPPQRTLTGPLPPEHYFDREAESNDPSFLKQSLTALWNPSSGGVKVV